MSRSTGRSGDLKRARTDEHPASERTKRDEIEVFSSDNASVTSPSNDEGKSPQSRKRLVWSDDEDPSAPYERFKKKKTDQRKAQVKQTLKAKASVSNPSIVGRKPTSIVNTKKPGRKRRHELQQGDSDSDDETIEKSLPTFLKKRRADWEHEHERLGNEGLNLPPLYDDIYFSDDDLNNELQIKPVFTHIKPVAPLKDVELRYSAGVIPAPLAQWLRDYQVKGAEFLHELFVFQKGGILGDDMGLGKTIQVIAFLTAAFGKTGDERDVKRMRKMRRAGGGRWYPKILIVCPGSLMENWRQELARWGWWNVDVYHGKDREQVLDAARQGRLEIMITTYTTYRNHKEIVNLIEWDACIADECHIIKERKAEITKAMDEVNALCRIGLTGTAIQNRYEELWTILNWTNPGRFGPISVWKASISEPLKQGQSHDATVAQLALARKTAKRLVQNLLPQFFLRRMKTLIADQLPKKTDRIVFCPLTPTQSEAYQRLVDCDQTELIRRSREKCECGSGKSRGACCHATLEDGTKWQSLVFPMLMLFQKLSNHLAMLIPSGTDLKDKQERELALLEEAVPDDWRRLYAERDNIMNFANQDYCGKWKVLKKLLRFWYTNPSPAGGPNKVLVFSHSVRLLKMLHMLFQSTTSYNVSYLDGSMPYEERQRTVDDFNAKESQFVFLISTRAGGVGLNITSANKVVVFDPNWNPSHDLQAQDRAYRIGQTRDVEVFRLVSAGGVEEIVYARQVYKQQQARIAYEASAQRRYFSGVQGSADQRGEIFGLANLFSFMESGVVLRDIVNKTNVAESRAGVAVAEFDSQAASPGDDDNDHDADGDALSRRAISQLAEEITGASPRPERKEEEGKTDAVAAILAGAGVQYTHDNSEVIGTSRVESHLSRQAESAAVDPRGGLEAVFLPDEDVGGKDKTDGDKGVRDVEGVRYKFRPPEEVRRRLFGAIAKWYQGQDGGDDVVGFALRVEGWSQAKRREVLDGFYRERRRVLAMRGE
ncbi:hypothetical protein K461DRAFT_257184 [Myriangium duriaei CBS 260.36]|uniref:Uncharacterized protein n=1 Tax=Myriangium duriaei CBS 260.36 TaxID=1168546 RepID=A0A9P4MLH2_9PEZI|nr:hypothetical protein K461DRAFT_257184 [Myriangium duriaei CBS 260.36]